MTTEFPFRQYRDAGVVLARALARRTEHLVSELSAAGEVQRGQAEQWVELLARRGRAVTSSVAGVVRSELAAPLSALGITPLEDVVTRVTTLVQHAAEAGRSAMFGTQESKDEHPPAGQDRPLADPDSEGSAGDPGTAVAGEPHPPGAVRGSGESEQRT